MRSPLYTARLSNEGGALKSFVLTHHRDGAGKSARPRAAGAAVSGRDAHARSGGRLPRAGREGALRRRARDRERRHDRPLPIPRGERRRLVQHLRLPGFVRRRREGRARRRARRRGRARPRARNRQSVPGGAREPLHEAGRDDHAQRVGLGRPQGEGRSQGSRAQGRGPRRRRARRQLLPRRVPPVGDRGRDAPARGPRGGTRSDPTASPRQPRPRAKSSCRRRTPSRRTSFSARRSSTSSRRRGPAWTASSTTGGMRSS